MSLRLSQALLALNGAYLERAAIGRGPVEEQLLADMDYREALDAALRIAAEDAPKPSCATCKWAEATDSPALLECLRAYENDSSASCGIITGSHVAMKGGAASLIVAPTFGCVQWEGK